MRAAGRSLTKPAPRPTGRKRLPQLRTAAAGLTRRGVQGHSGVAVSFAAEADSITAEFRRKLAALDRRMTPVEKVAAITALQDERDAALRALRERRAVIRGSGRMKVRLGTPRPWEGPS